MLHPVIMCGGAGVRLWPASRPERPKPFVPLVNGRTLFGLTLDRVKALGATQPPMIIAGAQQASLIGDELAAAALGGAVVIEPEARDSAPAMAAAAWLAMRTDPEAVCLFLAADHLIPNLTAFARTVAQAAEAATDGGIVTLGIQPTGPVTAYGYIRPGERTGAGVVRRVEAFVEKPDAARAAELIAEGCLWNSGMFIARAADLIAELSVHAPQIVSAAKSAVKEAVTEGGVIYLGEGFRRAPKISIDYAVMERTTKALVAPAEFIWSDLGAWPAVLEASRRDADGNAVIGPGQVEASQNVLVYAGGGARVAVRGASDLAVVAEGDQVMVCALNQADQVKGLVERTAAAVQPAFVSALEWRDRYQAWFDVGGLPVWWTLGADHDHGGFRELLGLDGRPIAAERRVRVQPRQIHVYAQAGLAGWAGPWRQAVEHGLVELRRRYQRPDGLYRYRLSADGSVIDDIAKLYDQAFVLLALSSACRAAVNPVAVQTEAVALHRRLKDLLALPAGGFREHDPRPFQSNPHQHLLEAALAWSETAPGEPWDSLARDLVELALTRFIDPDTGALLEYFDEAWRPADGPDGHVVEPGHQFEWCWLLGQWSRRTGDARALAAAIGLYEAGCRGVDLRRQVAMDELGPGRAPLRRSARLWPQTERVKAAVLMASLQPEQREVRLGEAAAAAAGLWRYLEGLPPGLYRDKQDPTGAFLVEPAQASSLYHLWGALEALRTL